jgi:flagellar biosynthetic protein FliQ
MDVVGRFAREKLWLGEYPVGEDLIIQLGQETIKTTIMISAPLLISTLVVGLAVSIFQAVTQINEATLSFIPKIVVIGIVIFLAGPWMLDRLTRFTIQTFDNISTHVRE